MASYARLELPYRWYRLNRGSPYTEWTAAETLHNKFQGDIHDAGMEMYR
jgi:hypothetical protein